MIEGGTEWRDWILNMTEEIQWWPSIHYIHLWFPWIAGPNEGWLLKRCQPCPVCLTLVRREELYKIHAGLFIVIAGYSWKKLTHNHKLLWKLLNSILSDLIFVSISYDSSKYCIHFYLIILHCSQCHNVIYKNWWRHRYIFVHQRFTPLNQLEKPVSRYGRRDVFTSSVAADVISALVPWRLCGSFFHVRNLPPPPQKKKRLSKLRLESDTFCCFFRSPKKHYTEFWPISWKKISG